ncbi:efflux RND transporter periplasmic adaptor subunit [Helicobacter sp. MIT 14-3879]|uniref:efflux RND transporter periplasmic adaptor subunit n=1 Tax=Helicobacter sp. MIT 14-3879 TaxID=2040649 RepID=UPI000E1E3556|nr:efflux RND transporter periplasmic adaptor subunit [Helicobacter sp. MIT 14-3879]RDU60874.1 efflux RND transporter periplasmic adaptor subunit [Helicobacter sp. MIT 14-3879]
MRLLSAKIGIPYCFVLNTLSIILLAMLLFGCSEEQKQANVASLSVNTQTIQTHNIMLDFEYPARLKSLQSAEIYARVEGILMEQNFKEGDIVQEGTKLFKIDPTRYAAKVNMARAQYEAALANLNKTTKDWKRVEKLYKQGVLTVDQYDDSLYNYQTAQANVANTKSSLDDALIDLGYTDVLASITGRIGMRGYDIGNLVGRSGANSVLATITQLNPIYIEFSIPSSDFYYMRGLQKENIAVNLILGNGLPYSKKGKVDFIDSVLDSQTSSIKARAIIDNDEYKLLPNQFVRIKLEGFEANDSIAIPQNTLMQDKDGSYVYLLKDGKATATRVTLGKTLKNNDILVVSGLKNGDILITSNLKKLQPGMNVVETGSVAKK